MIIFTRLRSFFNVVTSSIAFYPTLHAISAIIFGFLMMYAEERGISIFLQKNVPLLVINDIETARGVLNTLIAGGLSMLVFSFSMVMLLLSQAAANYSPRVLPNLISNRRHQTILGTFLAMILYNIITIIGIQPHGDNYQLPGFSVLLGIASAIVALGAFVYFIHSISSSIQINNILKNIFLLSKERLKILVNETEYGNDFPDSSSWKTYESPHSGSIQNISITGLQNFAAENDTKIDILISKGQYVFKGQSLIKSQKELTKEQAEDLFKNFNYTESELVSDNYVLGFKQITEIGVKAMSPGVNDPGTALDTINYLTELLALRIQKGDDSIVLNDKGDPVINLKVITFNDLIYNVLVPYRTYSKHDVSVMQKLLGMLKQLKSLKVADDSYCNVIDKEATSMMFDIKKSISNPQDLAVLQSIYDGMNIEKI